MNTAINSLDIRTLACIPDDLPYTKISVSDFENEVEQFNLFVFSNDNSYEDWDDTVHSTVLYHCVTVFRKTPPTSCTSISFKSDYGELYLFRVESIGKAQLPNATAYRFECRSVVYDTPIPHILVACHT